jgi:hypothetical protein
VKPINVLATPAKLPNSQPLMVKSDITARKTSSATNLPTNFYLSIKYFKAAIGGTTVLPLFVRDGLHHPEGFRAQKCIMGAEYCGKCGIGCVGGMARRPLECNVGLDEFFDMEMCMYCLYRQG